MLASISMDAAALIELLTPFFPGYFLPLASIANVGESFQSHICLDVCLYHHVDAHGYRHVIFYIQMRERNISGSGQGSI